MADIDRNRYQDMGRPAQTPVFSAADYLAWEATQAERHEFIDGEVFAMAGAEDRHVTVAGNLYMTLRQHLAGSPCRTYMSDMRLHVAAAESYFYPDVLVTCKQLQRCRGIAWSIVDAFESEGCSIGISGCIQCQFAGLYDL